MSKTIHQRLERLEARQPGKGPLFFSWMYDADRPLSAFANGLRFGKHASESTRDFMARVGHAVPNDAIVWIEQGRL